MRTWPLVFLPAIAWGVVVACGGGSSSDDNPTGPKDGGPSDAPLLGETSPPADDAEPPEGEPCGDARGLSSTAPWPLRGGCPKRANRAFGANGQGPQAPKLMWSVPLAAADTSPAVDQERVIWFGTAQGDIYGYTASPFGQAALRTGGAIKSSPAVNASGTVVFPGGDGNLYGVIRGGSGTFDGGPEAGTGPSIANAQVTFSLAVGPMASSPVIGADGTIYVGTTAGELAAIAGDGTAVKWRAKTNDTAGASPAIGKGGAIYVGSSDAHLYAIDPGGNVAWAFPTSGAAGSPAVGGDDTIYVATEDGTLHAVTPDGKAQWAYKTGGAIHGAPAVARSLVYVGSADKSLHAVKRATGEKAWTYATLGEVATPTITSEGTVCFGSTDFHMYAVTPSGNLLWAVNAKGRIHSAPALADGVLYVTTEDSFAAIGP